jgi:ligand-binding sensor domain-containing protein
MEAKTEFYAHDQHWSNRMISGDSLSVMASLAEREGLRGQVQCIYFDPPYGIKFNSNFQWSTTSRDVKDAVMDTRGFMWLATSMGLNRYDGNNFLLFTKEKNGLLSNDIECLIPHGNNRLIVQCFFRENSAVDPENNVIGFADKVDR